MIGGGVCQSCGMPMVQGDNGTEKDGTFSPDYCKRCYMDGEFTEALEFEEMVEKVANHLVKEMGVGKKEAKEVVEEKLKTLKRWQSG
ncbi:MAG: zinc ribbon domain-containing protein [Candidatus Anstonellales archaeon]